MVQIKQMLVPRNRANRVRFSGTNPKNKIVVHQTGNPDAGADAYMHAKLQYNGNSRAASWHYTVDDKVAYQSFPHTDKLWHAGHGGINKESIGVELAVNSDSDYDKAVKNGVELVKWLVDEENIDVVEVINHHDASGKWCPSNILNGQENLTWSWFKEALGGAVGAVTPSGSEQPSSQPAYNGSIVNYLDQQGIKSNFENRKNLAVEYSIVHKESDYVGSAQQNTALLNAMLTDEPKQEGTRKEPIQSGYTGNSIVDYLVSINKDASIENRKRLAKKHLGINNYVGTAKQNIDLLNAMRGGSSGGGSSNNNVTGYTGGSIVNYLKLNGNEHLGGATFENRERLANANGISNYRGTAAQNTELLRKLQAGGSSGGSSSGSSSQSVKAGDTVTTKALYSTAQSTENVRSSNIKGYVADIDNSRRNPIRLRNKKGGYYLGFTRKQDLV